MVIVQYTYIGKIVFSILNPEMKSCSQYMLSFYIMQCCTKQPFVELCWYHNIFEIGTSRKNEFGKYLDDYIAVKNILL